MAELTPLCRWHQRPPDHLVAVELGTPFYQRQLFARVAGWVEALQSRPGKRWAVYHSDSLEYLCILLALWQLERIACIPSDNRPATLKRLLGELDGLVGEFDHADAIGMPTENSPAHEDWIVLEPTAPALEIYTSGSTGNPKSIRKTIEQLERENEAIETLWPSQAGGIVLATVSHQHIFGMTFGLFWPFSSGRAFESRYCELNEDIRFKAAFYDRFALVSSPSHLGRFNEAIDWAEIADRCEYVVSSAAPLAREDSLKVQKLLEAPVREIYGSSETGAVAWRIQQADADEADWRPLPGVELETTAAGTMNLRSPYQREPECFEMPDRVEFNADGSFHLLGRVDSIVKVEGKRVSLAAIESEIQKSEWTKNVKALTLERARVETAIVMQLNPEGKAQLEKLGRRELINVFRERLKNSFEAVVIPRRWRFVDEMPFNRQGKLPLENLRMLFERKQSTQPQILSREDAHNKVVLHCRIPSDLLYFLGHMPDQPILAGIVQLHWAATFGRDTFAIPGRFERLEAVKFQQIILPLYEVTLTLNYDADSKKLAFRYESDRGVHSSGRICFSG